MNVSAAYGMNVCANESDDDRACDHDLHAGLTLPVELLDAESPFA
jgi:hypothetical protein